MLEKKNVTLGTEFLKLDAVKDKWHVNDRRMEKEPGSPDENP